MHQHLYPHRYLHTRFIPYHDLPLPILPLSTPATSTLQEMFLQGDREKQLGQPVSVLMDRTKAGIQKSQPGFFSVVAQPMYQVGAGQGGGDLARLFRCWAGRGASGQAQKVLDRVPAPPASLG